MVLIFIPKESQIIPIYSSEDKILDELLSGGFHKDFFYLLFGDRRLLVLILQETAIYSFQDRNFEKKVVYVDGNNRFNPYNISKLAVSQNLSPRAVLEHILISRSFTWEQMVELLENRISELDNIKIIMISGITSLWPDYTQQTFEGMIKASSGIKKIIIKANPLMILTDPIHEHSELKPKGGKYLQHFGTVLISIMNKES